MPTTINASNTTGGAVVTGDGSGILELQSGGVTGITVNGPNVTVAGTLTATGGIPAITTALTSPVSITGNSTAGAEIRLPEDTDNGNNYVAIKAPNSLAANITWTLPTTDGTSGQYLQTNGSGQLSFTTVDTTPIGAIQYYPTNMTLSASWLQANGSVVSQATYPALYAQVGLRFNTLDGTWTSKGVATSETFIGYEKNGFAVGNAIVACATSNGVYTSVWGLGWTQRLSNNTQCITYASGRFVAAGNGIFYSTDNGLNWTQSGFTAWFYGIAYGAGVFVVVGDGGKIWSSTDGTSWTVRTSGIATTLNAISFGNGLFTAVGDSGVVLTSPDGVTWTSRTSGTSNALYGVDYGASTWVMVGAGGSVFTSTDAITWTSRTSGTLQNFNEVRFLNNQFIAVGNQFVAYKSTNGVSWSGLSLDSSGTGWSAGYFNGMYLIGGVRTSQSGYYTSFDFDTGSGLGYINGASTNFQSVALGNGVYAIVTQAGHVFSSTDMVTLTCRYTRQSYQFQRVIFANNQFLAVGSQGTALTSPDGITWTYRNTGSTSPTWYGAAYGNSTYVIVADASRYSVSSDGITWTYTSTGFSVNDAYDIAFGAGLFVSVGSAGSIFTSSNGTSWTSRTSGVGGNLWKVSFVNNIFIAVGASGVILTSPNGITWTSRTSGTTEILYGISYSSQTGRYIVVGNNSTVRTSTDLVTWTAVSVGTTGALASAFAGSSAYYLTGGSPIISTGSYYSYNPATQFVLPQGNATGTEGVKAMIKAL